MYPAGELCCPTTALVTNCDRSVHLLETAIHVLVFDTNDLISELSGHNPALDRVSHSVTYTYTQRDIFALEQGSNDDR